MLSRRAGLSAIAGLSCCLTLLHGHGHGNDRDQAIAHSVATGAGLSNAHVYVSE